MQPDFFLPLVVKIQQERNKLKKELLSRNEPEFNNLRNSQPIQIGKNLKLGVSLLGNNVFERKPRI